MRERPDYTTAAHYWDEYARQPWADHESRAFARNMFYAGALAMRDLLQHMLEIGAEQAQDALTTIDTDLRAYVDSAQMAPLAPPGAQVAAQPDLQADPLADHTAFFDREIVPLMQAVVTRAREGGIPMLAVFEIARTGGSGEQAIIKLAPYMLTAQDGSVAQRMATAWNALTDDGATIAPYAEKRILH